MSDPHRHGRGEMCSALTRDRAEDPIANARKLDRMLLLELKKPWSRNRISSQNMNPGVQEVIERQRADAKRIRDEQGAEALAKRNMNVRLVFLAPDREYSVSGRTHAIYLRRSDGPFTRFERTELLLPDDELPAVVEALLYGGEVPESSLRYRRETGATRDILVCTQGNVDTCCATFGYPVYRALRREASNIGQPVRVWEATHFQAHRFAPVVLDIPEMRYWGLLDESSAISFLKRDMGAADIRRHYMGWAGYGASPYLQIAEREAFVRLGWDWPGYLQRGAHLREDEELESVCVRIDFERPESKTAGAFEALVSVSGRITVQNGCLKPGQETESKQYRVSSFAEV